MKRSSLILGYLLLAGSARRLPAQSVGATPTAIATATATARSSEARLPETHPGDVSRPDASKPTATMTPTASPTSIPRPSNPPGPFDSAKVSAEIWSLPFMQVLIAVLLFGALGGFVSELVTLAGNYEKPHRSTPETDKDLGDSVASPHHLQDLGVWARVIVGALAGAASLYFATDPTSAARIVSTALVAGSAGTAFFKALQNRITAIQAATDAAVTRTGLAQQTAKVEQALSAAKTGTSRAAAEGVGSSELREVEKLLHEARAIGDAYQKIPGPKR